VTHPHRRPRRKPRTSDPLHPKSAEDIWRQDEYLLAKVALGIPLAPSEQARYRAIPGAPPYQPPRPGPGPEPVPTEGPAPEPGPTGWHRDGRRPVRPAPRTRPRKGGVR
jgi:hypothetical protein